MLIIKIAVAVAVFAVAGYHILTYTLRRKVGPNGEKLPPSPPGKPLIGNVLELPKSQAWAALAEWRKTYGPIFSFNTFGQTHIAICKESIADELLRERGNIYSSRPPLQMAAKLISGNMRPVLLQYNALWREFRKYAHSNINSRQAHIYEPVQTDESVRVLHDLLRQPSKYATWFERYAAGVILRITYSKFIFTGEEEFLQRILAGVNNIERAVNPGQHLCDTFPILMWLPDFLAPFKRMGKKIHVAEAELFMSMLREVETKMEKGELEVENFSTKYLTSKHHYKLSYLEASYMIGSLFEAGAGTTSSALADFLLVAVHFPEKFQKIQEEVDRVVGGDRMPTLEDLEQLPYVRAAAKETVRWRPIIAGGLPHYTTADDTYTAPSGEKMFIPKNSLVHVNQWAIRNDESMYPQPDEYLPERWLEPGYPTYKEPLTKYPDLQNFFIFGNGRRICPGQNVAERSLFLLVSRIAWACNIRKARRPDGTEITPPKYEYSWGGSPNKFDLDLTAREGRQLIVDTEFDKLWAPRLKQHGVEPVA